MKRKINNKLGRNLQKRRTVDKLSKEGRSRLMSKIRSKNTQFEKTFIRELVKTTSIKFKTHVSTIGGTPDIVFMKQKICVFLDSDFWHGWQYPRWKHLLKDAFWKKKIESNRARDRRITRYLRLSGWGVLRFWEHNLKNESDKALNMILKTIKIRGKK